MKAAVVMALGVVALTGMTFRADPQELNVTVSGLA